MSLSRLAIVTPVFNDWACLQLLVDKIAELSPYFADIVVLAIDDGSVEPVGELRLPRGISAIEIVHLLCNVGHQKAIAIGLARSSVLPDVDLAIVMDCDGEDRPEDIRLLLEEYQKQPRAIVVAQRTKRRDPLVFRISYECYKLAFRFATGRTINFGNYCLIPAEHLPRLVHMNETWTHLAAALLKTRLPLAPVPCERGHRYNGKSSMNFISLVLHGFSAISVFVEAVFLRLALLCTFLAAMSALLGLGTVAIRLLTAAAIPGWATNVLGFAVSLFIQALTLLVIAVLLMLSNRSVAPIVAARGAEHFLRSVSRVQTS